MEYIKELKNKMQICWSQRYSNRETLRKRKKTLRGKTCLKSSTSGWTETTFDVSHLYS